MPEPLEDVANRIARLALRSVKGPVGRVGTGPVLAVVRDTTTGKIYVGLNTGAPPEMAQAIQQAVGEQKERIRKGEVKVVHSDPMAVDGGHAETVALNAAIRERESALKRKLTEADMHAFELHNVWIQGSRTGTAAPRCEHCARYTRSVVYTSSMFQAEGGVVGEVTVPQRGMVKRAGQLKGQPVTAAEGVIEPVGGRIGVRAGMGAALGGLLTGAAIIAEPLIKKWFADNYLKDKWTKEQREMVEKAINSSLWRYNLMVIAHWSEIEEERAKGRRVRLHVCVDTEWVDTDFGPAQIKAEVSFYDLLYGDDEPIQWPLWQPKHLFGPRITNRRECFDFDL